MFWERASGALVTDVDGNRYLDLTSAFGVAATGHTNPRVARAVAEQAQRLIHGMGDVHPTELRTRLLARLAQLAPGDLRKTYLATSGAEAVEFALKTALLATGKPRVLAYHGAYHGLSLGALEVAGIDKFRAPFAPLVPGRATFLPYPGADATVEGALGAVRTALGHDPDIGAVILEPIQGRGGVIVPPARLLARAARAVRRARPAADPRRDLHRVRAHRRDVRVRSRRRRPRSAVRRQGARRRRAALGDDRHAARDGRLAGQRRRSDPHLDVLGQPARVRGGAREPRRARAARRVGRVRAREAALGARLRALAACASVRDVRGVGFLWAVEFAHAAFANRVVVRGLAHGVILLQSGPTGTSITIAPPLTIGDEQLARALDVFERAVRETEERA